MKRLAAAVLVVMLIAGGMGSAFAFEKVKNSFSFRNGIHFGMSVDELIETEEKNGQLKKDEWDGEIVGNRMVLDSWFHTVDVSDYKAELLYYLIDEKMHVAGYGFENPDAYDPISHALSTVYGECEPIDKDEFYAVYKYMFDAEGTSIIKGFQWSLENVTIYQLTRDNLKGFVVYYCSPEIMNMVFTQNNRVNTQGI